MKKFFLAIFTSFLFAHVGFSNTHDWDEKYEEWLLNPEPDGGLEVLQKIKIAKENGDTELVISNIIRSMILSQSLD